MQKEIKDLRLINQLALHPGWTESLDEPLRLAIVEKLRAAMDIARTPREVSSMARALVALEQADVARARLLVDAQKATGPTEDDRQEVREFLEAVLDRRPGST